MTTKKRTLELLEKNRGVNISGTYIARQLNVSRNAIWKAIRELEKDGYKISALTNRGYCLCEENDILSAVGMLPFLSHKEIAERIWVYESLESTNKTAKEMAISGAKHGTVIMADCQTAGKGRYGREFYSPRGQGIYMSILLHPAQLMFNSPTLITSFAAVSVCEAIEAISDKKPRIKWVNDIFLNGKKICGILTEAATDFESGNIQWVVVGIGINFRKSVNGFPEDLRQIAGAIFSELSPTTNRNRLAAEIVNRVALGQQHSEKEMLNKYKSRLLFIGKELVVVGNGEEYEAMAVDIDDMGRLIVRKDTGELLSLAAGEIRILDKGLQNCQL